MNHQRITIQAFCKRYSLKADEVLAALDMYALPVRVYDSGNVAISGETHRILMVILIQVGLYRLTHCPIPSCNTSG